MLGYLYDGESATGRVVSWLIALLEYRGLCRAVLYEYDPVPHYLIPLGHSLYCLIDRLACPQRGLSFSRGTLVE